MPKLVNNLINFLEKWYTTKTTAVKSFKMKAPDGSTGLSCVFIFLKIHRSGSNPGTRRENVSTEL